MVNLLPVLCDLRSQRGLQSHGSKSKTGLRWKRNPANS